MKFVKLSVIIIMKHIFFYNDPFEYIHFIDALNYLKQNIQYSYGSYNTLKYDDYRIVRIDDDKISKFSFAMEVDLEKPILPKLLDQYKHKPNTDIITSDNRVGKIIMNMLNSSGMTKQNPKSMKFKRLDTDICFEKECRSSKQKNGYINCDSSKHKKIKNISNAVYNDLYSMMDIKK